MKNTDRVLLRPKTIRRVLFLLTIAVILSSLILILRSSYISNTLKEIIIPELEAASGQKVTIQKININIFPLFIEANDLRVSDGQGNSILISNRVKGYLDLSGLLGHHISIQRLVIKEPVISTKRGQIEEIIKTVKKYLAEERSTAFKVRIKVIEVVNGIFSLKDNYLKDAVEVSGIAGEIIFKKEPWLRMSIKKMGMGKRGLSELMGDINAFLIFKKDTIEIKKFEVVSYDYKLKGKSLYSKSTLKKDLSPAVDSLKRIFNLSRKGERKIYAKGELKFERVQDSAFSVQRLKDIFIDLKVNGYFYLQTLMKLLKVENQLNGLVDFKGNIRGYLSNISGKATARLRDGNLFGVDIDSINCDVLYKDGVMKFENGNASLYNGNAQADASLNLPGAEFFTLNIKFNSVDSSAALKLIGWEPEIPSGKVDGEMTTSGSKFSPDGWFVYKASGSEKTARIKGDQPSANNVLDRIKDIKGTYSERENILSLINMRLNTSKSNLDVDGTVDIAKKNLKLNSRLSTNEISDLTLPYYKGIKGRGNFSGEITGSFDNPRISGKSNMSNVTIEGYFINDIASAFSYEKNLLDVHETVFISPAEKHIIQGSISFPEAKELFDLSKPVYNLRASLDNAEFGQVAQIFYKDFSAKGRLDADINMMGRDKDFIITGKASVENVTLYKIPFDSASMAFSYTNKEFSLKNVAIKNGNSVLTAEGKLMADKRFSFRASSKKLFIKNFGLARMPDDTSVSLQSEGYGTFDNPTITLNAKVTGGTFKDRPIGDCTIYVAIKKRDITVNAALFNEKMILKGNGHLDEKLPWVAELNIQPGRYDFIVSSILKDVPEDLQLNLEGNVKMNGDRKNITASATINHLVLTLFEQTLSNDSNINFSVNNRKISLKPFTIKSGTSAFRVKGEVEIGKEYDILLDGNSSLSPLKGFSNKIGYLKGDADFVFSISGKWSKPEINGGMNISNASFGLKDYPTYISSINGYLYIEEDRIVMKKLTGKIGGGNVTMSGSLYLKAFRIKRFYLETDLDNITNMISKDFSINYNGSLLYKGTPDNQTVTGDIEIKRASYKEMVEWRSWLMTAKEIERPKTEASVFEKAELNIRVSGSNNISIDNNIARAPIKVDMILKGSISKPVLFGRLESTEGYIYFRNNEFRIIFASADFADPNRIKPIINLTAETEVKGYHIRLNLEGEIEHFNLSLSSDPYLEETDIFALLTVGQLGKQLKGLEGGIGAGEATSFLTGKAQDVLEERLRTIIGLDRFQVEPYVSKITGTVGARVSVSKRLIGDKLYVTYGTLLGSTEEQIIKLEYSLDKNISLIGIRDEIGSLGGDIKFRFEFK